MGRNNLLIGDIFANAARAVPDRTAVALGDASLTFGELDATSNQAARALASMGVGRGSRVVLWSPTDIRAAPLFAALAKLGSVFVPINGSLGPEEAAEIISSSRPDVVLSGLDQPVPIAGPPVLTLGDLGELAAPHLPAPVGGESPSGGDPHVAFFTSGSTGRPKGAVLSHEVNYLRSHPGAQLEPRGAMVCSFPLFHMGAWTIALQQWQARDSVVLVESADADDICEAVERHRATRLNCVPAVWRRILDSVSTSNAGSLASIRFADTGTSATPPELLRAIGDALPLAHLRVFYGSTEAGSVASLDHADMSAKPGSCGPPAPGVSVRLGEDGELWVRSPMLFDGYLDDPVATRAALVDGWYRTGDVAEEDGDGYLHIVGRLGDLVRTGGETVVPAEVEAVLAEHPSVGEVVVLGVPDPAWGEVVWAVVVPASGEAPPTLEELRSQCAGRLAPFKQPRRLRVVDALPRTASTGQIQRRVLVDRLVAG